MRQPLGVGKIDETSLYVTERGLRTIRKVTFTPTGNMQLSMEQVDGFSLIGCWLSAYLYIQYIILSYTDQTQGFAEVGLLKCFDFLGAPLVAFVVAPAYP